MTPFGQTSVRAITIRRHTDRGPANTAYIARLRPLVILDEGHKAYSRNARATLEGFNPCMSAAGPAGPSYAAPIRAAISRSPITSTSSEIGYRSSPAQTTNVRSGRTSSRAW